MATTLQRTTPHTFVKEITTQRGGQPENRILVLLEPDAIISQLVLFKNPRKQSLRLFRHKTTHLANRMVSGTVAGRC